MEEIKSFLSRASLIRPPNQVLRLAAQSSIKEIVGQKIKLTNLVNRGGALFVRASPLVKNQIFLKKKEILSSVKKILGQQKGLLADIR